MVLLILLFLIDVRYLSEVYISEALGDKLLF